MIPINALPRSLLGIFLALVAVPVHSAPNGESPAAIRCLETIPANPDAAISEAEALYQAGDTIGARHCLGDALVARGEVARGARILDELAREIAKARDVTPALRGAVWGDAGRAWLETDDVVRGLAAFDAAIQNLPEEWQLRVDRAVAFGSARRFWDAIDDLNAAIAGGIDTAEVFLLRATAYREVGSTELAMEDINRAAQKAPNDPDVLLERGRVRKLAKDNPGAQADFLSVIKIAPSTGTGAAARHELESLTERRRR